MTTTSQSNSRYFVFLAERTYPREKDQNKKESKRAYERVRREHERIMISEDKTKTFLMGHAKTDETLPIFDYGENIKIVSVKLAGLKR